MLTNKTGGLLLQTMLYLVNQKGNDYVDTNALYHVKAGEETQIKCYGVYGCFNISEPWTSESRPIALFPESPEKINPQYAMYTRKNQEIATYLDIGDPFVIQKSKIDPTIPIYFIAHGYLEAGDRPWIQEMVVALLNYTSCTVIVVDWRGGSGPPYTQAVANIRLVGSITAHMIENMAQVMGHDIVDRIHLIGHSLGAHLSGYIGYTLKYEFGLIISRISGLDPAEPHFSKSAPIVRLDQSAAKYVDVIHTDASGFISGGLGMLERVGHVDYYPNGGSRQPGCDDSIMNYIASEKGSFIKGIRKFLGCNHIRSYEYFTESINANCLFTTISCSSYEDFLKGECFECGKDHQHCVQFGYHSIKSYNKLMRDGNITENEPIVTYLLTAKRKPFCRAHYKIELELSNATEAVLHRGEFGIVYLTIHGRKGITEPMPLTEKPSYHEPGKTYKLVVPGGEIGEPLYVTLEWVYQTSVLNPFTWRLTNPRIYISKIVLKSLEYQQSLTLCPEYVSVFYANQPRELTKEFCNKKPMYV